MSCPNCEEMRQDIAKLIANYVPTNAEQAAALERAKSHLSTPEERGERPLFPE